MTPETYMRRFHSTQEQDGPACPLTAEDLFPCRPETESEDPSTQTSCCCKASMVEALRLLCDSRLAALVDFDSFFFLTDSLAVGGCLTIPYQRTDNICALNASFRRFSPCNCDLLDVQGTAYFALPGSDTVALEDIDQLSLCAVQAVAFQLLDSNCPRDCDDDNFHRAVRLIRRAIQAEGGDTSGCGSCVAHCDCDGCTCCGGILAELSTRNLSRLATLTVGRLVLQGVTVLGSVGSALILADEDSQRFYLVCTDHVEALG